jgi:hypothetical protein
LSGATTPFASASRSSAADLPEKSAPVADLAALVARLAPFWAFCWRARAWPPFFAAALRLACPPERELVERLELALRLEELRAPEPDRERLLLLLDLARPDELREPEPPLFEPDERRPPLDPPDD